MTSTAPKRNYEESCVALQHLGYLDGSPIPPMPSRRPLHDDPGPLGVSFFRMQVIGDFSRMTLPRTFFGKSEITDASFVQSDLAESTLCWCDFDRVDFSGACLTQSDLRAARFERVNFAWCDLRHADLRQSDFINCDFTNTRVDGMKLTNEQRASIRLSPQQTSVVDWQASAGDAPGGG